MQAALEDIVYEIATNPRPQASIDATGSPLTDEALKAAQTADAVLLGAIGGPVSRQSFFPPLLSIPLCGVSR